MNEETWSRVRRLFEEALELPVDGREAHVRAGTADPAEAEQVLAMLRVDAETEGPVESRQRVLDAWVASAEANAAEGTLPTRFGEYEVVDVLGQGGMGSVYRARHADPALDREVAVKVIRGSHRTPELVERFRAEATILSRLAHPNIAHLYDVGVDEEGRPYLVLELVRGRPIDVHCDDQRLSPRDRLRMFLPVCRAVSAAHRNLVVHRDIKPSNVLVDEAGVPKLLDFGIAKLVDEADSPGLTRTGVRILTPEYASPEQTSGLAATTQSDVFSLGVVLHELLTGHRPTATDSGTTPELPSRAVTKPVETTRGDGTRETLAPEEIGARRATSIDRLKRMLRGDLDRILLKALAEDPAERYASVDAFSADLDRYLAGLPILARRPSLPYRIRKFTVRNRSAVAVAATLGIAFLVSATLMAFQAREAAQEREVAAQLGSFLEDLFEAPDPRNEEWRDSTTLGEFLLGAEERVRTAADLSPSVRARMLSLLGTTYGNMGLSDRAVPVLEEASEALRADRGDPEQLVRVLLATSVHHGRRGETAQARDALAEAEAVARSEFGTDSRERARTLEHRARTYLETVEPDSAIRLASEAREILDSGFPDAHRDRATVLNTLGSAFSQAGSDAEALPLIEEAVRLYDLDPDAVAEDRAIWRSNLAQLYGALGRNQESLAMAEEALALVEGAFDRPHPTVALTRVSAAEAAWRAWVEEPDSALAQRADGLFRSGLEMARGLPEGETILLTSLFNHGRFLQMTGDLDGAESALRETRSLSRRVLGPDHPNLIPITAALADLLRESGQLAEAVAMAEQAYTRQREVDAENVPFLVFTGIHYGRTLNALGRHQAAADLLGPLLETATEALGAAHPQVGPVRSELAGALRALGRTEEAERLETQPSG